MTKEELRSARAKYKNHKDNAKRRKHEFLLTFEEWYSIWEASGHFSERGLGSQKYVMARFDDKGPYAVGNVKIITQAANLQEQWARPETREKILKAVKGNHFARGNKSSRDRVYTSTEKQNRSVAQKQRFAGASGKGILRRLVEESAEKRRIPILCQTSGIYFSCLREAVESTGLTKAQISRSCRTGIPVPNTVRTFVLCIQSI